MKKHLLVLVLMLVTASNLWAQRDTEHWFAAMRDRASSTSSQQTVFLSTDSVIPFAVNIYNNNAVIGTVTISKGSPGTFVVPKTAIIATTDAECMVNSTKGFTFREKDLFTQACESLSLLTGNLSLPKGKPGLAPSSEQLLPLITT
ncbi:hypothetical protein [Marnyiella aurantia]|uniref:hypothetical protein n=1 Tax=Marnyiella aurantia TaxID=2758037 RepID=UPI001FD83C81|nr:hypothetical protein [Marnyiella aurantia]